MFHISINNSMIFLEVEWYGSGKSPRLNVRSSWHQLRVHLLTLSNFPTVFAASIAGTAGSLFHTKPISRFTVFHSNRQSFLLLFQHFEPFFIISPFLRFRLIFFSMRLQHKLNTKNRICLNPNSRE